MSFSLIDYQEITKTRNKVKHIYCLFQRKSVVHDKERAFLNKLAKLSLLFEIPKE